ncbi:MAG TPA: hypothetical protein VFT71_07205 [Candidatus Nitrosocosmicus sp.]|nr:hypothetical protein [Candidatus Nitrosocosmicus sp.]
MFKRILQPERINKSFGPKKIIDKEKPLTVIRSLTSYLAIELRSRICPRRVDILWSLTLKVVISEKTTNSFYRSLKWILKKYLFLLITMVIKLLLYVINIIASDFW